MTQFSLRRGFESLPLRQPVLLQDDALLEFPISPRPQLDSHGGTGGNGGRQSRQRLALSEFNATDGMRVVGRRCVRAKPNHKGRTMNFIFMGFERKGEWHHGPQGASVDVQAMTLQSEPVTCNQKKDPRDKFHDWDKDYDASDEELDFLVQRQVASKLWRGKRVELNAMSNTRAGFPSEGFLATPMFLIRPAPAASHSETRYLRIGFRERRRTLRHPARSGLPRAALPVALGSRYKRFGDSCVKYNSPLNNWKY